MLDMHPKLRIQEHFFFIEHSFPLSYLSFHNNCSRACCCADCKGNTPLCAGNVKQQHKNNYSWKKCTLWKTIIQQIKGQFCKDNNNNTISLGDNFISSDVSTHA